MVLVLTKILHFVAGLVRLTRPLLALISPESLFIADHPWFPPGLVRLCIPLRI
jgi:hypothetical protein